MDITISRTDKKKKNIEQVDRIAVKGNGIHLVIHEDGPGRVRILAPDGILAVFPRARSCITIWLPVDDAGEVIEE